MENKCFSKQFRQALPEAKVYRSAIDISMDNPPMGRLLSITATKVPVQGAELRVHRPGRKPKHLCGRVWRAPARRGCSRAAAHLPLDGTLPMLTTYLSGTMPILRRRGLFILICAKRILNRRVAAAIAYREEQVSPASTVNWNASHRSARNGTHTPMLFGNGTVNK
jgi:hypothetical protein